MDPEEEAPKRGRGRPRKDEPKREAEKPILGTKEKRVKFAVNRGVFYVHGKYYYQGEGFAVKESDAVLLRRNPGVVEVKEG